MEDSGDNDVVINPTFSLQMSCTSRRLGLPVQRVELRSPEDRYLAEWFLQLLRKSAEGTAPLLPSELVPAAMRAGLLISTKEHPGSAMPYRCDIDSTLLPLVPDARLDEARAAIKGDVILNPNIIEQTTRNIPSVAGSGLAFDERLWRHLGASFKPHVPVGFSESLPILWVGNPSLGVYEPLWLAGDGVEATMRLLAGGCVKDVPPELRMLLLLCHVLIPSGTITGDEARNDCRHDLISKNVAVLRNMLSPLQLAALRRHFRQVRQAGWFQLDEEQVRGQRDGAYADPVSLFFQALLLPAIAAIVGSPIRPTYTWVFRYRPGAKLERHKDRPQCRWNVSFCVDEEGEYPTPWPLCFGTEHGEESVDLAIGDAVVYSGTDVWHWRPALPRGRAYTVSLFHYVPAPFIESLR